MEFSIYDIILLSPIVYSMFRGYSRGIILELLSLFNIFLSLFITFYYSNEISDFINIFFNIKLPYVSIISFILSFFLLNLIFKLISAIIYKLFDVFSLSFVLSISGAFFAMFKMAIILSAILMVVDFIPRELDVKFDKFKSSITYRTIKPIVPWLYEKVKEEKLVDKLKKNFK